jgi:hypothetical protein
MLSATRSHWRQEIGARHVAVDVYIVVVDEALIHEHLPSDGAIGLAEEITRAKAL